MKQANALLLYYAMKQQQLLKAMTSSFAGLPRPQPSADEDGKVRMTETRVYIGLNDSETSQQKYDTGKYLDTLKEVCRGYHTAFSVDIEEGGYYHEDGEYVEETSLILVLINADRDTVQKIAGDLRSFFHQESVLVTESVVTGCFITE